MQQISAKKSMGVDTTWTRVWEYGSRHDMMGKVIHGELGKKIKKQGVYALP